MASRLTEATNVDGDRRAAQVSAVRRELDLERAGRYLRYRRVYRTGCGSRPLVITTVKSSERPSAEIT